MTYFLRFAYQLKKEGSQIIGEPNFDKSSVRVGTPEVEDVIQLLLNSFTQVAHISSEDTSQKPSKKKGKGFSNKSKKQKVDEQEIPSTQSTLQLVEDGAFIAKSSDISSEVITEVSEMLAKILAKLLSTCQNSEILSSNLDPDFLVLIEAIELRSFLSRFVKNEAKISLYDQGFLYVFRA